MPSSICIPRIETNISREYIMHTLQKLKIGYIKHITEIPLRNDPTHKRIIIKLDWNTEVKSIDIQKKLTELGSIKLVHNMPWYWKIVPTHQQI